MAAIHEIAWPKRRRFKDDAELLSLVYLKCFQRLGYFPKPNDIPISIITYILSFSRLTVDNPSSG